MVFSDLNKDACIQPFSEHCGAVPNFPDGSFAYSEILQENNYYPFGMQMEGPWQEVISAPENGYTYNGKELNQDFDLNWLDYGARWYDPSIGRWNAVDALAEKYSDLSPYNYVANNPLKFIDPDGNEIILAGSKKHKRQMIRMMNENAKRVRFSLGKRGRVQSTVTDSKAAKGSTYTSTMLNAVNDEQSVTYNLKKDGRGAIGSYWTGDVYMNDLALLDDDSDVQSAFIAHFTVERFGTENYEKERYNVLARNDATGEYDQIYEGAASVRMDVLNEVGGKEYDSEERTGGKMGNGNSVNVFIFKGKENSKMTIAFVQDAKTRKLIGIDIQDGSRSVSRQKNK